MKKSKLNVLKFALLGTLILLGCGEKSPLKKQPLDSLKIVNENNSGKLKNNNSLCNQQLLQNNGLEILSTNAAECIQLELSGDVRCAQMAQYTDLENLDLEFYFENTGEPQCGCQCAEEEPSFAEVSPCMEGIRDTLLAIPNGGHSNYIFTENYILMSTVDSNFNLEPSRNRCKFRDNLFSTNFDLEAVLVELNGQTYFACKCSDTADTACTLTASCEVSTPCNFSDPTSNEATQYNDFGEGTLEEPYRIYTGAQFFDMSRNLGALDKNYELCADVDLNDFYASSENRSYFAIGSTTGPTSQPLEYEFEGTFDGRCHSISNFTYDDSGPHYVDAVISPVYALDSPGTILRNSNRYIGLFGALKGAQIENLNLLDVNLNMLRGYQIGGLVGTAKSRSQGPIYEAYEKSTVRNILVTGNVRTYGPSVNPQGDDIGGIMGFFYGDASNLTSEVRVHGGNSPLAVFTATGGLSAVLYTDSTLTQAIATGDVTGGDNAGGLVGSNSGLITNSCATGNVSRATSEIMSHSMGGLVAENINFGTIENSYATGDISGQYSVGGLVGDHSTVNTTISESYATGNVSGQGSVGGLVGGASDLIRKSYATGNVSGENSVGGLIGSLSWSNVQDCYATGDVLSFSFGVFEARNAGGLIGTNGNNNGLSLVSNSYATGNVSGNNSLGGLIGLNTGSVHNVFSLQQSINGILDVGPVIGKNMPVSGVSTFSDIHYWSGVNCTGSPCIANNGEESHDSQNYFFDSANAPMNVWDFISIWNSDGLTLPTLN